MSQKFGRINPVSFFIIQEKTGCRKISNTLKLAE